MAVDRGAKEPCPACGTLGIRSSRARHARACPGWPLPPGQTMHTWSARGRVTTMAEVMAKVDRRGPDVCWMWQGAVTGRGYGSVRMGGTTRGVHRVVYEHFNGPIPDGFVVDHLCRNTLCVNPSHLEAVTTAENNRRGLKGFELTGLCRSGRHGQSGWRKQKDGTWLCMECVTENRAVITDALTPKENDS